MNKALSTVRIQHGLTFLGEVGNDLRCMHRMCRPYIYALAMMNAQIRCVETLCIFVLVAQAAHSGKGLGSGREYSPIVYQEKASVEADLR